MVTFSRLPRQLRVLFVSYDDNDTNANSFKETYSNNVNDGSTVTIIRHTSPGTTAHWLGCFGLACWSLTLLVWCVCVTVMVMV
jgi:hypothetical protein